MFRKMLLAWVAALGFLSPLAFPAGADAREYHREHHHAYRVYYLDPYRPVWLFAGSFREHWAAERLAAQYRWQGFAVRIR